MLWIPGFLNMPTNRLYRDIVRFRVEITANGNQGVQALMVEYVVNEQPHLQRLSYPLHRRDKAPLGPGRNGFPCEAVNLLSRNVGSKLRFQVNVGEMQGQPWPYVDLGIEYGPFPLDWLRGGIWWDSRSHLVTGAWPGAIPDNLGVRDRES